MELVEKMQQDLSAFLSDHSDRVPSTDLRVALEPLSLSLAILTTHLQELGTDPGWGFRLTQCLRAVDTHIDYADAVLAMKATAPNPGVWGAIKTAFGTLMGSLRTVLQSLSAQIGQLISLYLTVKEWSIKGTVATPSIVNFLGAQGSVELEVTFGP